MVYTHGQYCLGTGLLCLLPILASSSTQLIIFFGLTGLLYGGIMTSSNSLIGLAVPVSMQGIAYGLFHSASALGSGIGPFTGRLLSRATGLRYIFAGNAMLYILVSLIALKILPSGSRSSQERET
ncbi:MAG: MFS transporter [Dehalococcoidales bacterium]|nr:MFS transporter [Dehalococcoidales bacterium]